MKPLFFDIEAGGLSGHRSSLLSITWASGSNKPTTLVAKPEVGSLLSRWSAKKVWEPLRNRPGIVSEKEALTHFLGVLHQHDTLVGWNIGYNISPQTIDSTVGPRGFDIPMILTRAKAHGLEEAFATQFSKMNIRDLGREHAVHLAGEVSKYPHLVDPQLFAQAESFAKVADIKRKVEGLTGPRLAEAMSPYYLSGWKQETVAKLHGFSYAVHQSEHDVAALQKIAAMGTTSLSGPAMVSAWNKEALVNRLVSASFSGKKKEETGDFFSSLLSRAEKFNVSAEFQSRLTGEAELRGASVANLKKGLGFIEEMTKVRKPIKVLDFAMEHPFIVGGVIAGLAVAMKPLRRVSGKDDDHNTIEGLAHGGEAERMRHLHTDFGSGYRGILNIEKGIAKYIPEFLGVHTNIGSLANFIKEGRSKVGKLGGLFNRLTGEAGKLEKLASQLKQTYESGFKTFVAINPSGIKKEAKFLKTSASGLLKSTIAHERFHQNISFAGVQKELSEITSIVHPEFIKKFERDYAGRADPKMLVEEYVAHAVSYHPKFFGGKSPIANYEEVYGKGRKLYEALPKLSGAQMRIPGKDDAYNTIEGLRHGGLAEKFRKIFSDFGSGWLRKAVSMGMEHASIARAITKEGIGKFAGTAAEYEGKVLSHLSSGNVEEAVKFVRSNTRIATTEGKSWILDKKMAEGGFGSVHSVFNPQTKQEGVLKLLKTKSMNINEMNKEGKMIVGPALGRLLKQGEAGLEKNLNYAERYTKEMIQSAKPFKGEVGLQYEAKMQKAARQQYGSMVPEVLGETKEGFIQEKLQTLSTSKSKMGALSWMKETYRTMYEGKGIMHYDPHLGNVMRKGGQYKIIDWGVAAEGLSTNKAARLSSGLDSIDKYARVETGRLMSESLPPSISPILPPAPEGSVTGMIATGKVDISSSTANINKSNWNQAHKNAMKQTSQFAKGPGQRHTMKTGKLVL
jgi:hypothetical protein